MPNARRTPIPRAPRPDATLDADAAVGPADGQQAVALWRRVVPGRGAALLDAVIASPRPAPRADA